MIEMMTTAPARTIVRLMPMSKILAALKVGYKIISTTVKGDIFFCGTSKSLKKWTGRCHKSFCANKFNLINSAFSAALIEGI